MFRLPLQLTERTFISTNCRGSSGCPSQPLHFLHFSKDNSFSPCQIPAPLPAHLQSSSVLILSPTLTVAHTCYKQPLCSHIQVSPGLQRTARTKERMFLQKEEPCSP